MAYFCLSFNPVKYSFTPMFPFNGHYVSAGACTLLGPKYQNSFLKGVQNSMFFVSQLWKVKNWVENDDSFGCHFQWLTPIELKFYMEQHNTCNIFSCFLAPPLKMLKKSESLFFRKYVFDSVRHEKSVLFQHFQTWIYKTWKNVTGIVLRHVKFQLNRS